VPAAPAGQRELVDLLIHCGIFSKLIQHYRTMMAFVNPATSRVYRRFNAGPPIEQRNGA